MMTDETYLKLSRGVANHDYGWSLGISSIRSLRTSGLLIAFMTVGESNICSTYNTILMCTACTLSVLNTFTKVIVEEIAECQSMRLIIVQQGP